MDDGLDNSYFFILDQSYLKGRKGVNQNQLESVVQGEGEVREE